MTSTIPTTRLTTTPDPTSADADDDFGFTETWTEQRYNRCQR